jgi:hypothetical protein
MPGVFEVPDVLWMREASTDVFLEVPKDMSIEDKQPHTSNSTLRPEEAGPTTAHVSFSLMCHVKFRKKAESDSPRG